MIALYVTGGILLLVFLLLQLRLALWVTFDREVRVWAKILWLRFDLYPIPEKKKKTGKPKKDDASVQSPKKKKLSLTWTEIRELLPAAWESLQRGLSATRKRVVVDPVEVSIIIGGEDPAEVAQCYGWGNAVLWTVMPRLEELTRMPRPHVHLGMDYDAEKTAAHGTVGFRLRLWDGLCILWAFGRPLLQWKKNRTKHPQGTAAAPGTPPQSPQKKTA